MTIDQAKTVYCAQDPYFIYIRIVVNKGVREGFYVAMIVL